MNTIRIYAAGGAGINIASTFSVDQSAVSETNSLFAKTDICYIDTSASNLLGKSLDSDKVHIYEGMDGSGKIRSANATDISKGTLSVLQKYPPMSLNLVIHSASGGSGSVCGPAIVSELKKRGEQVIVLMVGSTSSTLERKNTFKTLETYESISKLRNSSVVSYYVSNAVGGRTTSDRDVLYAITLLCGLYNGQHSELDSADLKSWLGYATTATSVPTLASLSVSDDKSELAKLSKVVSVATLATTNMDTDVDPTPPYQTVGFVPSSWGSVLTGTGRIIDNQPIHFAISFDLLAKTYANLKKLVEADEAKVASELATNVVFNSTSNATADGLVL